VSHTDVICADRMGANKQPRFALGTLPGVYRGGNPLMLDTIPSPQPPRKAVATWL
jgi:hypothetical protein